MKRNKYSSVADDWERTYTYDRLGRRLTYVEGELVESLTYDGGNLSTHTQSWLENGNTQTKTTHYHYTAHRLDSVGYDDALTTIYHYDQYGRVDSLYDESGVMCYTYGNMGEVTQETRIYALPFLSQPIALATQFTYDSWGRIQSITYPDNEVVSYGYDCGGQLQSITNNSSYTYLDNVSYDRFGAKVSQTYGNGLVTNYSYNNLTRRLSNIATMNGNSQVSSFAYTYDNVGNVTQVTSSCPWLTNQSFTESFTYDASDQLTTASETQAQSYSLSVSYDNWGKMENYDILYTDLLNSTTTQDNRTFSYPDANSLQDAQTLFAPEQCAGTTDVAFTFGINGSLRRREVSNPQPYTEYYLFNSAANMKAYSNNGLDVAYYGYNAANSRSYKLSFLNQNQWVNGQPEPLDLQLQSAMFYPNAYVNFNHNGEYTKHYYNGAERIASRLGITATPVSVTANARLSSRSTQLDNRFQEDILDLMPEGVSASYSGGVNVSSLQSPTGTSDIYYYHTNHLGNTAFVTDQNQNVTQGFLYAPFGEITTEYNSTFGNDVLPKYSFNAKELDEETGMYYYEARYYKPPVFTSRDPMFEKKPWSSPYVYCKNNPVLFIDPDGRDEWKVDEMGYVSKTGNKGGIKQQTVIFSNGNTKTFNGKNYHVILSDLTKVEKRDGKNLSKSLGDENMQSAMLNVFKSMADNTNVEWRLDRYNNGNNRNCYAIGTIHDESYSPGAEHMGYSQQSVIAFVHSHPGINIYDELSSMGWISEYIFYRPSDYNNNTNNPKYFKTVSYVYCPNSGNLWHVRKGKIPCFIKKIKQTSDFFFGTLNTR